MTDRPSGSRRSISVFVLLLVAAAIITGLSAGGWQRLRELWPTDAARHQTETSAQHRERVEAIERLIPAAPIPDIVRTTERPPLPRPSLPDFPVLDVLSGDEAAPTAESDEP